MFTVVTMRPILDEINETFNLVPKIQHKEAKRARNPLLSN